MVTWSIATNRINQPVDHIFVSYHIDGSSDVKLVRVPSTVSRLMLDGLFSHTRYVVHVSTNNMAGNSTSSIRRFFTTAKGGTNNHNNMCTNTIV